MTAATDRRSAERSRLPLAVLCAISPEQFVEVTLVEASLDGCQVTTPHGPLDIGADVVITPPAMHGLPGTVRWATAKSAGIEFETPLAQVVLMHLLYEPADSGDWDFVDGFGRRLPSQRKPKPRAVRRK
jgi:hypothetical protein